MSDKIENESLLIDETFSSLLTEHEAAEIKPIQKKLMESYIANKDDMTVEEWLTQELKDSMPEKSEDEVGKISSEIIATIKLNEKKQCSLEKAIESGRSKEAWFASEMKQVTSHMSGQEASKYLQNLDDALVSANEKLHRTIITQSGTINQNSLLDGFIAEQHHAQTFNINAQAKGSQYRAKVLQPEGKGYSKNSVDIVIVDGNGKTVRRYQSKYCKDTESTRQAFEKGDYRGQRKLVPDGQETYIKNSTNVIEAPDGTKSNVLSKESAKELQREAQSGNWNDLNWNEYKAKDLAMGIGKQAGQAALMGAAVGVGFNVAQKVWEGDSIDGEELVEVALSSGADFGIKAASAGALKIGIEKGIIKAIPKGTPAGTIASIAHVAVENAKVIKEMATGELTMQEGFDKMERVTFSTVAGIVASTKGMATGATIGVVLGPAGAVIGGFVGGTVGYMAGSKVGETVVKGVQKIRKAVNETIKSVRSSIRSSVSNFCSGVKSFASGLLGW